MEIFDILILVMGYLHLSKLVKVHGLYTFIQNLSYVHISKYITK